MADEIDLTPYMNGVTCTSRTLENWNEHHRDASPKFLVMHVNVDGSFRKLERFIEKLERKPDILCVSETQLDRGTLLDNNTLNNYNVIDHQNSECNDIYKAGGAEILLKQDSQIKTAERLQTPEIRQFNECPTKSESVWIPFQHSGSGATFIAASVCRHKKKVCENSADEFVQKLKDVVEQLTFPTIVLGDMNIDLKVKASNRHAHAQKILGMLNATEGRLLIDKRTGRDADTLNDHIYAFNFGENVESGVISTSQFAHHPVYFVV